MKKLKIYISGKITGNPDYKAQFAAAAEHIRALGDIPLNPAELPQGMSPADYMRICFAMVDTADEVLMIYPEWQDSPGARLEKAYAEYIGKEIMFW